MVPAQIQKVKPNLRHCKPSVLFYRVFFPDHLDSGFHFIVDYLLEAVASMMLGFHFIGVAGGCWFSWVSIL